MGKSTQHNAAAEQEFSKMARLLIQTADEAVRCLKALKTNLAEYDKRHGLLFLNTSKSFMRSDIRAAKDKASELKHVADQITMAKAPSEWEITATRSKIHEVSDALIKLKRTARAYDRKNNMGSIDPEDRSSNQSNDNAESEGSWFSEDSNSDRSGSTADTVEVVVKSTVHHNFSGFFALKHQISIAEDSLSPSFADRFMDTVNTVSDSLKGAAFFGTETKDNESMSV
ncbi:Hypothetical protein PHPALM_789 [Phytophthora palmivora]|uniref:Uncharacterized protein n=1 Tax=Phytophthora palmivora TaxID=4796 RepID=A0A2P4YTZ7_9STRA|nr:Hypothetical protein PHPALM_789 [Phytophthora palmivora]